MTGTEELQEFTIRVADAIREKTGMTGEINPLDFATAIYNISAESDTTLSSDVNFYDYDGTILYSYTKEQFLALTTMPKLPTREGLICQGWNWVLDKAKEYVADYGMLNIGTMYITDDGDTRLYIRIAAEGRMTVPLYWSQTIANGVNIDWGDGSNIEYFSGTGNKNTTHTYAKHGDYVIRLKVADSCVLGLGNGSSSYCVMGSTNIAYRVYTNMLQKVEIGTCVTNIGAYAFYYCNSLKSISIPSSVTDISNYAFSYCYTLSSISIPSSVTSIGGYAFAYCNGLTGIEIPYGVTSIGNSAFNGCQILTSIQIPNSVTSISDSMLYNCYSLASINIPNSVANIANNAFGFCYSMAFYDFTKHTSVPTLAGQSAFNRIPSDCVIKVPMSLLSDWESTTNWSAFDIEIIGV